MAIKTEEFEGVMDSSLVQIEMCSPPQLLLEDEGRIFLQKTGTYLPNYAVSHPRKL
jgi:hypothetical protein